MAPFFDGSAVISHLANSLKTKLGKVHSRLEGLPPTVAPGCRSFEPEMHDCDWQEANAGCSGCFCRNACPQEFSVHWQWDYQFAFSCQRLGDSGSVSFLAS